MRFIAPVIALLAAAVSAQTNPNYIVVPDTGLKVSVGQNTIKWINPTSGTVTIKLQQGSAITPDSGIVVASGIPASAMTATFNIAANSVNTFQYSFEIIDDTNPSVYNFSPNFGIVGATGTGNTVSASSSVGTAPVAPTASTTSAGIITITGTSTTTRATTGTTTTQTSTRTTSASTSPTTGAASMMAVNGGLAVLLAGVVMAF